MKTNQKQILQYQAIILSAEIAKNGSHPQSFYKNLIPGLTKHQNAISKVFAYALDNKMITKQIEDQEITAIKMVSNTQKASKLTHLRLKSELTTYEDISNYSKVFVKLARLYLDCHCFNRKRRLQAMSDYINDNPNAVKELNSFLKLNLRTYQRDIKEVIQMKKEVSIHIENFNSNHQMTAEQKQEIIKEVVSEVMARSTADSSIFENQKLSDHFKNQTKLN